MRRTLAAVLLVVLAVAGCSSDDGVDVDDVTERAWIAVYESGRFDDDLAGFSDAVDGLVDICTDDDAELVDLVLESDAVRELVAVACPQILEP